MMKIEDCADYIVEQALEQKLTITNLQLQKTLFILVCHYNTYYGNDFDISEFEMWDYSPVHPKSYHAYNGYMTLPIENVNQHLVFDGQAFKFIAHKFKLANIDPRFQQLVKDTLSEILNHNIFDITNFLCRQPIYQAHLDEIRKQKCPHYPKNTLQLSKL